MKLNKKPGEINALIFTCLPQRRKKRGFFLLCQQSELSHGSFYCRAAIIAFPFSTCVHFNHAFCDMMKKREFFLFLPVQTVLHERF
ncbi:MULTISPECIES: hypothetical protein [Tenebrionibacter/Tenebrionicola group]|uniref:Uncharacterized protein n=2 Tax=Tenebrionibacter/Tenebrionicola group TaxID=2969848 RepID=A0A8K0XVH5_9ENTR|nr:MULTISPECIES: hypothetical protein [Tenebrionibacter/Tenebrionicola group]MBK4713866.1 hypothetical protein [Tenebrionibacter intestinalis]MBV5094747.1 hypothetical protein [Tenebrionicola larvae]